MDIVDAQVHLNHVGIEAGIAAMDAAGVNAAVIDELTGYDDRGRPLPGYVLSNGSLRHEQPLSEQAVAEHPDRFAYIARVEPDDEEIADVMAGIRRRPGRLALRLLTNGRWEGPLEVRGKAFAAALRAGAYDAYLALAARNGTPVFIQMNGLELPGDLASLTLILEQYPDLVVILDHIGIALPDEKGIHRPHRFDQLDEVLRLARFPQLFLKWGHALTLSEEEYPYADVRVQLHRVVDAFGAHRVMWASDWTMDLKWNTLADSFGYIRDDSTLSMEDREWILGRTVRIVLGWPSPLTSA